MAPWHFIYGFSVGKGLIVAVTMFLIGTTFGQSLVITIVSGLISALGMVGAAYLTLHAAERNRAEIRKTRRDVKAVKRTLGANKRQEDEYDDFEDE